MTTRNVLIGLLVAAGVAVAIPAAATPVCTAPARLVQFPTAAPVWEMCLLTPTQSSGFNGSGMEIRDAYYYGHKVFKRAHTPVLNVKYVGALRSKRDTKHQAVRLKIDLSSRQQAVGNRS